MTASIINGKPVATAIKQKIQQQVEASIRKNCRPPGLAVILLGEDHASTIYVNAKRRACLEVGFQSFAHNLPVHTTEKELLFLIDKLNHDHEVDGILVQLPLPAHIDKNTVIEHISPHKDVDGFHPYNFGRLAQGNPTLRPCTPYGVIRLLAHYQLAVEGKNVVVIGASNIVGRPMSLEFLLAKATVTVCHKQTSQLESYVRTADIIVSATGVRHIVDIDWLNKEQIIIDIGMHRLHDNTVCGDLDFHQAKHQVAWITPVPGGVGPMTIAMLLENTMSIYTHST